jgi:hypothetical protein
MLEEISSRTDPLVWARSDSVAGIDGSDFVAGFRKVTGRPGMEYHDGQKAATLRHMLAQD